MGLSEDGRGVLQKKQWLKVLMFRSGFLTNKIWVHKEEEEEEEEDLPDSLWVCGNGNETPDS